MIHRLADSAERIQPLLAALALVQELSNGCFDQFIATPQPPMAILIRAALD
ncbi:MAG: hypothetical protein NTV52_24575 [Acidobacteria bacterium]|nr:hypothetical protein [Acidobacteriota bacterium]